MCRCTWSTTASVKNPRATPDWLVTIDRAGPRGLKARIASMLQGYSVHDRADRGSRLSSMSVPSRSRNTAASRHDGAPR